jgi:hypothetical protein
MLCTPRQHAVYCVKFSHLTSHFLSININIKWPSASAYPDIPMSSVVV